MNSVADSEQTAMKLKKKFPASILSVNQEPTANGKMNATKQQQNSTATGNLRVESEVSDDPEALPTSVVSHEPTATKKSNATKQQKKSTATGNVRDQGDDDLEALPTSVVSHERKTKRKLNAANLSAHVDDDPEAPMAKIKKGWHKRPENWDAIAEEAKSNGDLSALTVFESDFVGVSSSAAYQRLSRWKKDIEKAPVDEKRCNSRMPSYGNAIDQLVHDDYARDCEAGITVDDEDLRKYLVTHLFAAEKQGLLKEEGGQNLYGHSWAQRFYKRHNEKKKKKLKSWHKRPENWDAIAEEAKSNGDHAALTVFESVFVGVSSTATYQRLSRWKKDISTNNVSHTYSRTPSYGGVIDLLVRDDYARDKEAGVAIDEQDLRKYLVAHLHAAEKQGLLVEEGGLNTYGHSWAQRFYKRHQIVRKSRSKDKK